MTIIERIFETMTEKDIKQIDLANAINKNKSQITSWKQRNCDPPADLIPDIAKLLNVSIEYIMTGNEQQKSSNFQTTNNDESELLKNYKKLDQRGKHKIHTVIYEELDRIEAESKETQKHA